MAEDIGSLSVTLSLQSDSFTQGMASVERQLKASDAAFKASVTESGKMADSFGQLGEKQKTLATNLALQNKAIGSAEKELGRLTKTYADLSREQATLPAKVAAAKDAFSKSAKELKDHEKAADLDAAAMGKLAQKTGELEAEYKRLQAQQNAIPRSMDGIQKQIESTTIKYEKLREQAARTREEMATAWGNSMINMGGQVQAVGQKISDMGGRTTRAVTLPIVGAMTLAVKSAIEFESAFAGVRKTVDATEQEFEALSDGIAAMSNRMPFTVTEIAGVEAAAGQLGIKAKDLEAFTEVMLKMGVATDMTAEDAATSMARFAAITGMSISDVDRLGSTIVALGNSFATTEQEIMDLGMRLSAAGSQAGMSEASVMGLATGLKQVGLEAEAGGTAFSKVILDMDMAAAKGEQSMKRYADVAGMSAKEFKKLWEQDAAAAMVKFVEGLGKVEEKGGNLALTLEKLGYKEVRVRDTLMRAAGASRDMAGAVGMANAAWEKNIALQNEYDQKAGTMESRLKVLKNQGESALRGFGEAAMPAMETLLAGVGGLVTQFGALDEKTRQNILFGAGAAAAVGPALKATGEMTKGVGLLMKAVGGISKMVGSGGLVSMIGAAGPWLMAAAGVTALAYALGTAEREAKALQESVKAVDFNIDTGNIAGIQESLDRGKTDYTLYADVKLQMRTKADELYNQLDAAMADGRFTGKEKRAWVKNVNDWVDEGAKQVEEYYSTQIKNLENAMANITIGDSFDTTAIVNAVNIQLAQLATDLTGLDFLTPEQIQQIMALAVDPGVTDLNAELVKIGIMDQQQQQAVVAAVQANMTALDNQLAGMGILNPETRKIIVEKAGQNVVALGAEIGAAGVSPDAAAGVASLLGNFALEADAKLKETGIPILADAGVRDQLVQAAMKGPEELKTLLSNRKLFTEADSEIIGKILDTTPLDAAINSFDPFGNVDKAALDAKWVAGYSSLTSAIEGLPAMAEGQVSLSLESMQAKAASVKAELAAIKTELSDIANQAYAEEREFTDAEVQRIDALLARLAELQTQIGLLGNAEHEYVAASATIVKAGHGDTEQFGVALGYDAEKFNTEKELAKADMIQGIAELSTLREQADKAMAEGLAGAQALADKYTAEVAKIEAEETAAVAALAASRAENTAALFEGMAKQFPEAAAKFAEMAGEYDTLGMLQKLFDKDDLTKADVESVLTPELLKKFFNLDIANVGAAIDAGIIDARYAAELAGKLQKSLAEGIKGVENTEGGTALMELLLGSLGGLEGLDLSAIGGPLLEMLKVLDFKTVFGEEGAGGKLNFTEIGKAVAEGAGEGVTDNASLATDPVTILGEDMIKAFKTALGIASPSQEFMDAGLSIMDGLAQGISDGSSRALEPLKTLSAELSAMGADLVDSLVSGVTANAYKLSEALTAMVDDAMAGARNALDMHSPSRVAMRDGSMVVAGYAEGIEENAPRVLAAARQMAHGTAWELSEGTESLGRDVNLQPTRGEGAVFNITIHSPKPVNIREATKLFRREAVRLGMA